MELLDPTFYAVLISAGFVLAAVHVVMTRGASVLGWACVFAALAWNALTFT